MLLIAPDCTAYACHAGVLGYTDQTVNTFLAKALFAIGEDWGMDELLAIVLEVEQINFMCMEMLDQANTETCCKPANWETTPQSAQNRPGIIPLSPSPLVFYVGNCAKTHEFRGVLYGNPDSSIL